MHFYLSLQWNFVGLNLTQVKICCDNLEEPPAKNYVRWEVTKIRGKKIKKFKQFKETLLSLIYFASYTLNWLAANRAFGPLLLASGMDWNGLVKMSCLKFKQLDVYCLMMQIANKSK